jgi:dienelactone hydrolase
MIGGPLPGFGVMAQEVLSPPMAPRRKVLIAAAPVVVCLAAFAAGYDYVRGATFVIQAAGMGGAARAVAEWNADEVAELDTQIPWRGGSLRGRVFAPASAGRLSPGAVESPPDAPATLLVPGVHAGGIDEPRLIQFARDLASMGRIVVAAELPDLKQYRITARTTDMIEDAAAWVSSRRGFAPTGRIGLMGISFAGGLSIVAGSREALRHRVAFAMSFGGHGDLPRTLKYLCTGELPDGSILPPHDYGVAIILLGVADRLVPEKQAQPLREAILAFLHASHVDMWDKAQGATEFAKAKRMAESLPEPAATLMHHVNDRSVARLGPLLLPHVAELGGDQALSPSKSAAPAFPVYLLHGTDDNVIPAMESVLLAETLRERGAEVTQLATPLITHAEVDRGAAARAVWELVGFWADLLSEG